MKKAYIVSHDESTLCLVRCENSSKARYEAFKLYGSLFGVEFIEFEVSVRRFKELDNLNFEIIDAADIGTGTEMEHKDFWNREEIINAVKIEVA